MRHVTLVEVCKHFSSTFLQPINGSKNWILNWFMKLNHFICWKSLKDFKFYSPIYLSDFFSSSRKCIFQWPGDLNFKILYGDNKLSNKQTVKKLNLWRKCLDKSLSMIIALIIMKIFNLRIWQKRLWFYLWFWVYRENRLCSLLT